MEKRKRGRPRKHPKPPVQQPPAPEVNPQPQPEEAPQPSANLSGSAIPSPDTAAADAVFGEASLRIVEAAGETAPADEALPPGTLEAQTHIIPGMGPLTISPEGVRLYIDAPFNGLAKRFKNENLKLDDFDRELFVPAVTGCLNRYLPDFLKRFDSPELALLALALVVYATKAGGAALVEKIMARFKAPTTETGPSPASKASSASPEPARPIAPSSGFAIPIASSSSTA